MRSLTDNFRCAAALAFRSTQPAFATTSLALTCRLRVPIEVSGPQNARPNSCREFRLMSGERFEELILTGPGYW